MIKNWLSLLCFVVVVFLGIRLLPSDNGTQNGLVFDTENDNASSMKKGIGVNGASDTTGVGVAAWETSQKIVIGDFIEILRSNGNEQDVLPRFSANPFVSGTSIIIEDLRCVPDTARFTANSLLTMLIVNSLEETLNTEKQIDLGLIGYTNSNGAGLYNIELFRE